MLGSKIKCSEEILLYYSDCFKEILDETKTLYKLVQIPSSDQKKCPQKQCHICTTKHVRKDTLLMYSSCEDFLGLCRIQFDLYNKPLK